MSDLGPTRTALRATHRLIVLAKRSMYDPTIEEYLCCVWNVVEGPQR